MKINANNADTVFWCNNLTCCVQYEDVLSLHAGDFLVVLLHLEIKQHLNVDVSLSVSSRSHHCLPENIYYQSVWIQLIKLYCLVCLKLM